MAKNFNTLLEKMTPEGRAIVETRVERTLELMALHDLRRSRKMSQVQVAEKLGVAQSEVSKIESRADMRLSTIREYVAALGGRCEISVVFPESRIIVEFGMKD